MDGIALPIILLVVGTLALFLEAFIPSAGLLTVVGIASVSGAVVLAFAKHGETVGVVFLALSVVLVPTSLITAFTLFRKSRMGRRLTLENSQSQESGYVTQDLKERELLGQKGVAISMLRPSGKAKIGGHRCDVITEGEMIEPGTEIEVRQVDGNRIVVRSVRSNRKEA